jgi:hypothetical protein
MKTIVLVLRSGGDFKFCDVLLIKHHILKNWGKGKPRIICFWDKASIKYDLGDIEIIPLETKLRGTWSRMLLYSPEMEQYKPFLYLDLDTAVFGKLQDLIGFVEAHYKDKFIALEDFYQKNRLATGIVWFPANCSKTKKVWQFWCKRGNAAGNRMDYFLRKILKPDLFWQNITNRIYDFKPHNTILKVLPEDTLLICFHGKPRIFNANVDWVKKYVDDCFISYKITVIIPYKEDRGWLEAAIRSVPANVQLLISQGEGNWPENFNKVLPQVQGKYVKFLHEDDMLTENCIEDSVRTIEEQDVDFIHGNAVEKYMKGGYGKYIPSIKRPTISDLMKKNVIHSVTLMYKKEIFDKIGGFDETLNTQEEYEFNLRCLKAGFKIGYCDCELGIYRRHPKQKVRIVSKQDKVKEKELVNEKYS